MVASARLRFHDIPGLALNDDERDRLILTLTAILILFGVVAFLLSFGAILGRHM